MSRTYHHGLKARERCNKIDYWCRNEPKYWRKMHKHKVRRTAARKCVSQVMKGEDGVIWPLDKQPWIYYW